MNLQQAGPLPRPLAVSNHDVTGIGSSLSHKCDMAIASAGQWG
jgi:hypothetical protein